MHFYDYNPPSSGTRYAWWHQKCLNCKRVGHTRKYCDRLAIKPRCTYCGIAGHKRANCIEKANNREHNRRKTRAVHDVVNELTSAERLNTVVHNSAPPSSASMSEDLDIIIESETFMTNARRHNTETTVDSAVPENQDDELQGAVGGQERKATPEVDDKEVIIGEITGLLRRLMRR